MLVVLSESLLQRIFLDTAKINITYWHFRLHDVPGGRLGNEDELHDLPGGLGDEVHIVAD